MFKNGEFRFGPITFLKGAGASVVSVMVDLNRYAPKLVRGNPYITIDNSQYNLYVSAGVNFSVITTSFYYNVRENNYRPQIEIGWGSE